MTDLASNRACKRFTTWLAANGAEVQQPRGQFQWARFEAHGILCIVYANGSGALGSFVPALAREVYDAWKGGRTLDLREEAAPDVEDHHARSARLHALQQRRAGGEALDLDAEATNFGMTGRRLRDTLDAWDRSLKARAAV